MSSNPVTLHRWARSQYEQMITAGVFHPEDRVELIEGEIIQMTPQSSSHAVAVRLTEIALTSAFGTGYDVRVQMPLALDDSSEPEPDIAVVVGSPRDYRDAHPSTALSVVEVSDSTLAFDQKRKLALYARNGVPEYWIVNLSGRCLEVYRSPDRDTYREHVTLQSDETIGPLACAEIRITVTDLLP